MTRVGLVKGLGATNERSGWTRASPVHVATLGFRAATFWDDGPARAWIASDKLLDRVHPIFRRLNR